MNVYLVGIAVCTFLAAIAFAYALRPGRQADKVQASLGRLDQYDTRSFRERELSPPARERLVSPLVARLAGAGRLVTPTGRISRLQERVEQAGRPWNLDVNALLAIKFVLLLVAVLLFALIANSRSLPTVWIVAIGAGLGLAAYYAPDLVVHAWKGKRQELISRSFPDFLDLLTVTVEAGLGLESALARVASRVRGPLGEEILITLHHMRIGQSRDVALKHMAHRCDDPDVEHFVATLIQSQRLGVSLGNILRTQSATMRTTRKQRVEEAAQKAPVKMLFPLVFCIFPTLFLVILGPAAIRIYYIFVR